MRPGNRDQLRDCLRQAGRAGVPLIPFGGRHSMGAQQFGSGAIAVDMRGLNRVLGLEERTGIIELEAGITWPEIREYLDRVVPDPSSTVAANGWAIAQKQTGADRLTIGGALASNVHGRGLGRAPIIDDVESFVLLAPDGRFVECSRTENSDLFALAVGGYGLFGLVYSVCLRLAPRTKMQRVVRAAEANSVMSRFDDRIAAGFEFGDFQFQIDDQSEGFLNDGIFSCYRPVADDTSMPSEGVTPVLRAEDWMNLLHLAHVDKGRGFQLYREHYHRTDGSLHWSDSHQFTTYVDDYHQEIDRRRGSRCPGSEMISELYVPREKLSRFLDLARADLRRLGASVIYGTVRLIERDTESFLRWAREPWACVIFNLCVEHSPSGLDKARAEFLLLIDRALQLGGSYYLTYHKFADRERLEAAYPQMVEFAKLKREWDPHGRFDSDWWRHQKALLAN